MRQKMQAAMVEQFGKPLKIRKIDVPTPGPGQTPREDGGLRRLPHRPARRQWRLAGAAHAAVHARGRGGKLKADIELQPLSAINNVFERLAHGDVPSRVVLDFSTSQGH